MSQPSQNIAESGFSLIELLIVIAILGLLATFTITGFKDIALSRGVGQAGSDVSSLLELARNEAVTRQTYVWAAFREATNNGALEIQMALAASKDGTTNAASTNLLSISRLVRSQSVGLAEWSLLKPQTQSLLANSPAPLDVSKNRSGIVYTNLTQARFTNTTITFTPRSEAMLSGSPTANDGFTPIIAIGIVPARGDQRDSTKNDDCAVVIDGSTGMNRVLRAR